MKKQKGFTLLELIMVIVIIGILAMLAMPTYFKTVERSRIAEAKKMLGMIRASQLRYYAEHAKFTSSLNDLDIEVPASGKFFNFTAVAATTASPTAVIGQADRNSNAQVFGTYTVQVQVGGNFTCPTCPSEIQNWF